MIYHYRLRFCICLHPTICSSVVEPAQVVLAPDNTQVGSGSTLMFTCLGYGMPSPSITWMKNGVLLSSNSDPDRITTYEANITEGGVTLMRSFLKICNVGPSDEGQYSCVASNGVNSTSNFQMNISGWLFAFWHHVCAPYQFAKHLSSENFRSIGECLPLENDPLNSDFPSITLTWPETDINATHSHPCPCLDNLGMPAQQPVVTRRCGGNQTSAAGARWQPVDYSQCGFNDTAFQLCATELVWGHLHYRNNYSKGSLCIPDYCNAYLI